MYNAITPYRNSDTREWPKTPLQRNKTYEFGLNPSIFPPNAAVSMNLAAVGTGQSGFLTVWPVGSSKPNASCLNFEGKGAHNGFTVVEVKDWKFNLEVSANAHLIIDVVGYWTP
jgi:hypothetical protein